MTRHKERRHNLIVPLLIILCLMIVMHLYTSRLINRVAVSNIQEVGEDRLFDKFERVDLNRNSTVEGTGLGLAITLRLLAMMGGSISVDSVYGKGSTFTVTIPQGIVSREPLGNFRERFEKSIHQSRTHSESSHAPNARILIVDDTRMNLAVVTGLLKNTLPAEKIESLQPEQRSEAAESATETLDHGDEKAFAPLRAAGITPETGLLYREGDVGLYRSLLLEYSQSAQENTRGLEACCAARDWKSYGILAHSLKSTSRMIGATGLSEIAQRLEAAADRGDEATIVGEHADMLAQYGAVVHGIRQLLGEQEETADDIDILEFMPEEE